MDTTVEFEMYNKSNRDISDVQEMMKSFMPFAQKRIGFNRPPTIVFDSNDENAKKIFGKTAYYEPSTYTVTVYVNSRHPKDILRSISHELVHHAQNCRGEFKDGANTNPGYAQEDGHMREMEREAYETGNMCFRDWEDMRKKKLNETIYKRHNKGDVTMSLKDWKNKELNSLIMEKFGYKPKKVVDEGLGHDFVDTAATAEKNLPEEEKPVVEIDDDEHVVEEDHPMSADQRLKELESLDEEKLRSIIREKVLSALKKG